MREYLFLLIFLLSATSPCRAQDANYWSSNYGPGGFLTPGATLSNNRDSGLFFFNPALLGYSTHSSAAVSGTIYQYRATNIRNGVGQGLDLKSSGGSVIPQMVSSNISLKLKGRPVTIAYALIHEPTMSFQTTQRRDARFQVLSDAYSPGPEYFLGQYAQSNNIDLTTGVLSVGTLLTPKLAVGFSIEGNIRKQVYNGSYSARALINAGTDTLFRPIASSEETYQVNYTHFGLRFKGGIAYDIDEQNHIGLTISSPMVHLGGSGTLVSDNQVNNLHLDTLFNFYLLASTRQTGLTPRYKMPVSFALGYTWHADKMELYFSSEYFFRIKTYNIITPRNDYFIRPDTANNAATSDLLKFVDGRTAIFNLAAGMSYNFTPVVTGYFGVRTDFTYYSADNLKDGNQSMISQWDQYHSQIGVNVKRRKFNLRAGLLLTYGHTNKYEQPVNFDNPNEENLLLGDAHATKAGVWSAGLLLSYLHNLN